MRHNSEAARGRNPRVFETLSMRIYILGRVVAEAALAYVFAAPLIGLGAEPQFLLWSLLTALIIVVSPPRARRLLAIMVVVIPPTVLNLSASLDMVIQSWLAWRLLVCPTVEQPWNGIEVLPVWITLPLVGSLVDLTVRSQTYPPPSTAVLPVTHNAFLAGMIVLLLWIPLWMTMRAVDRPVTGSHTERARTGTLPLVIAATIVLVASWASWATGPNPPLTGIEAFTGCVAAPRACRAPSGVTYPGGHQAPRGGRSHSTPGHFSHGRSPLSPKRPELDIAGVGLGLGIVAFLLRRRLGSVSEVPVQTETWTRTDDIGASTPRRWPYSRPSAGTRSGEIRLKYRTTLQGGHRDALSHLTESQRAEYYPARYNE